MRTCVRAVLGDVSGEVAVFGSLNADLTVRTERFPKPGETISGEDLVILPGGKSANQAVQAGLLGAHVRMIGAVGADGHGDLLIESLQRAGVDTSAVQREDVATGTAIITVDSAGDNTIVVSPGANGTVDVSTAQQHQDVIGEARVLGLCMEVSPDAVEAAARIAHDAGTRVVFNNSPFHPVLSAGLLEAIDVLVVNEHELADMLKLGTSDAAAEPEGGRADDATDWGDCARRLAAMGIPSAVVTLGGRGSMVIEGRRSPRSILSRRMSWTPPVPVTPSWARCWRRSPQAPGSRRRQVRPRPSPPLRRLLWGRRPPTGTSPQSSSTSDKHGSTSG